MLQFTVTIPLASQLIHILLFIQDDIPIVCLLYCGRSHYQLLSPIAITDCNYIDCSEYNSDQSKHKLTLQTPSKTEHSSNTTDTTQNIFSEGIQDSTSPQITSENSNCPFQSENVEIKKTVEDLSRITLSDLQSLYNAVPMKSENRNGWVVDYNPILTAILGCNTNSLLLGSSE